MLEHRIVIKKYILEENGECSYFNKTIDDFYVYPHWESPKSAKATVGKGWLTMMVSSGNLLDDIMGLLLSEEAENIIYIDVHLRDWFNGDFYTVKHKIVPWEVPGRNELKEVLTRKIEHMYHELINYGSNAHYRHEHMQMDIVRKMVAKEGGYYDEIKDHFDT